LTLQVLLGLIFGKQNLLLLKSKQLVDKE